MQQQQKTTNQLNSLSSFQMTDPRLSSTLLPSALSWLIDWLIDCWIICIDFWILLLFFSFFVERLLILSTNYGSFLYISLVSICIFFSFHFISFRPIVVQHLFFFSKWRYGWIARNKTDTILNVSCLHRNNNKKTTLGTIYWPLWVYRIHFVLDFHPSTWVLFSCGDLKDVLKRSSRLLWALIWPL